MIGETQMVFRRLLFLINECRTITRDLAKERRVTLDRVEVGKLE